MHRRGECAYFVYSVVKTTGEAGGLHWPYKGLIQPRLKTHERFARPLRKFCVSDFRQKQEYHMYAVHDGAYSPCLSLSQEGGTVCAPLAA